MPGHIWAMPQTILAHTNSVRTTSAPDCILDCLRYSARINIYHMPLAWDYKSWIQEYNFVQVQATAWKHQFWKEPIWITRFQRWRVLPHGGISSHFFLFAPCIGISMFKSQYFPCGGKPPQFCFFGGWNLSRAQVHYCTIMHPTHPNSGYPLQVKVFIN